MPTYEHYQTLKAENVLPGHPNIGACLTCTYWQVEERRTEKIVPNVALCVHPTLLPYSVIVSGGSACNLWEAKPNKEPEAAEYAERGEEDKAAQLAKGASLM